MPKIKLKTDQKVKSVFQKYPSHIREKILKLRALILESAEEIEEIKELEETLKWGEPSYISKIGSTIRIDWKEKTPEKYSIYFKCTSKLVPNFKKAFKDKFTFEGNRAITFDLEEKITEKQLKKCIKAALTYHKIKNLPDLGL